MHAPIPRHKAAMFRSKPSFPLRVALQKGLLVADSSILDYGCGRSFDARWLLAKGYQCTYYDPYYFPNTKIRKSHTVLLTYVLNVIEDIAERERTLIKAFKLATEQLIVSSVVRASYIGHQPYGDGYLTKRGTFEKFWAAQELQHFIEDVLDAPAQRLDQGVYLVRPNPNSKPVSFHSLSELAKSTWHQYLLNQQQQQSIIANSLNLPTDIFLERYVVRGYEYWRLRSLSCSIEGSKRALYLGKQGSEIYNKVIAVMEARDKLEQIKRRLLKLQACQTITKNKEFELIPRTA